jgi:hypothetical protein
MTRLVAAFFLCITFLLTVTWIIPGARPPDMSAALPVAVPKPAARLATVELPAKPAPEAQRPAAEAPAAAPAVPMSPRAAQASACDTDPIRCMIEGKPAADPAEVTGTVVPSRKPQARPVPHHPARP